MFSHVSSPVMPRFKRGIQCAAAYRLKYRRSGILNRPIKSGDETAQLFDS
jgi:hypothetical protein